MAATALEEVEAAEVTEATGVTEMIAARFVWPLERTKE